MMRGIPLCRCVAPRVFGRHGGSVSLAGGRWYPTPSVRVLLRCDECGSKGLLDLCTPVMFPGDASEVEVVISEKHHVSVRPKYRLACYEETA